MAYNKKSFFVLIILVNLLQISTTQNTEKPGCKSEGVYCQNHWDCCSNSCLSYLNKCVKSSAENAGATTSIFLGQTAPLHDRFSEEPKKTTLEELLSSLFIPTEHPPLTKKQQLEFISRIGVEADSNSTTSNSEGSSSVVSPECLKVGQKCYRDSECCTERCHGFLHQCVT